MTTPSIQYNTTQILKYGAALGNAYIRPQVSSAGVRSVTAAKMAGDHDFSEFDPGVIFGAREMGHSISEVAICWGFSHTIVSRVHREYQESGKTSNLWHRYCRNKNLQEWHQRRRKRIIQRDRSASLPQIADAFNAGPSTSFNIRNHSKKHNRYGLSESKANSSTLADCTAQGFRPRLARQHRHWRVDDRKHFASLTSLAFNCI